MKSPRDRDLSALNASLQDWFIQGIIHDGSVGQCLGAVAQELGTKLSFVKLLAEKLAGDRKTGIDAVSSVAQRIKVLHETLRSRLPLLVPEREGAWFRPALVTNGSAAGSGPSKWSGQILSDPVFAPYVADQISALRTGILDAWASGDVTVLPAFQQAPSLWRLVLTARMDLLNISRCSEPFGELSLFTLPDGLPSDLESGALRAFLASVRKDMNAAQEMLGHCYALLLQASEKLWQAQDRRTKEQARSQGHSQDQTSSQQKESGRDQSRRERAGARSHQTNHGADTMREEFQRRRQESKTAMRTPRDIEAMRFMGFAEFPNSLELKRRYHILAKQMHPDHGGSEDSFKLLSRAYSHLSALSR